MVVNHKQMQSVIDSFAFSESTAFLKSLTLLSNEIPFAAVQTYAYLSDSKHH